MWYSYSKLDVAYKIWPYIKRIRQSSIANRRWPFDFLLRRLAAIWNISVSAPYQMDNLQSYSPINFSELVTNWLGVGQLVNADHRYHCVFSTFKSFYSEVVRKNQIQTESRNTGTCHLHSPTPSQFVSGSAYKAVWLGHIEGPFSHILGQIL